VADVLCFAPQWRVVATLCTLALCLMSGATAVDAADDDPASYIRFVEEPTAGCVARNGVQIQVRSVHPSRAVRVWLDRKLMGKGTGDRSRSELKPGGAPEPLGCSRTDGAEQAWVLVRAAFVD
jgi:hypothetical protein